MDQDIDIESPCIDLGECCGRHRWLAVGSLTVVDDGGGFYLPTPLTAAPELCSHGKHAEGVAR